MPSLIVKSGKKRNIENESWDLLRPNYLNVTTFQSLPPKGGKTKIYLFSQLDGSNNDDNYSIMYQFQGAWPGTAVTGVNTTTNHCDTAKILL